MSHLIDFDKLEWNEPALGVRYKAFINGDQQIKLVEFSEGFVEPDWCVKGHAGYVLDGTFSIDYCGNSEQYKKGDIIFIPSEKHAKHKVILSEGEKVTLLEFGNIAGGEYEFE